MKDQDKRNPAEELVGDIERRQRNITFPDAMLNSSNADDLMWHGSPRITKVQRVGVGLFGIAFLMASVGLGNIMVQDRAWPALVVSTGFAYVGYRLLRNSIRKSDRTDHRRNPR
jgi:hypothetical protein